MNNLKVYISSFLVQDIEFIIASNECGVIYLSNDQTPEYVNRHIERFYNQANKVTGYEADQYHTHYIEDLKLYFAGKQQYLEWPLNLAGTDYQKSIWQTLLTIPYGETRSYSDIALQSGNMKAVRAVGGAIGANPVMIAVPCHRVIGKNGTLTGFSGGLDLKEKLLNIENIQL
ncbi:methylated-DNA--[protein]-cysteine S-methyltransferase [Macrococcoides canis]|nr:methylated-DNA--[protein]-cysteine S-methyltransferase [Macrococcus canis]